jgi:hypothetical protein
MIDAPNEQSRAAASDFSRANQPDAMPVDERTRDARRAPVLRERLLESERREDEDIIAIAAAYALLEGV